MARINVTEVGSGPDSFEYDVEIVEDGGSTRHRVRVGKEYYEKLSQGRIGPEKLVEKSFEFLLEREAKESILRGFDLSVISKYFKDYPSRIRDYF